MSEKRLRTSILGLLAALAVASFGCGGGSNANPAKGGGFTASVVPGIESTSGSESGNDPESSTQQVQTPQQSVGNGNKEEDEDNTPGSTTASTPSNGGNDPQSSTQNPQNTQQLTDDDYADLPLPGIHGLGESRITVEPGDSEEHGNIVFTCPAGGGACVVNIGPDGTATYDKSGGVPDFTLLPPEELPGLPLQGRLQAAQAPIVDLGGVLHVGTDVAPRADALAERGTYNDVAIRAGQVQDGLGADVVIAYLRHNYKVGLETFPARPVVRLAEGTSDAFTDYAMRAIQLINAALPYEKRLVFKSDPSPPLASFDNLLDDVPEGAIYIDFVPGERWNPSVENAVGLAANSVRLLSRDPETEEEIYEKVNSRVMVDAESMLKARVFNFNTGNWKIRVLEERVDDTDTLVKLFSDDTVIKIVAHELLHALAFPNHGDPARFPGSIMASQIVPGHILFPLDRETLRMAYTRFEPAAALADISLENLGSWTDTSFHLRGKVDFPGGAASFGVASANGFAQPWAMGSTPWTNLADNQYLSGSAAWNGALLGVNSSSETVAGDAGLTVNLTSLTGQLAFTNMKKWGVEKAPGAADSGTTWGDGDLAYTIKVRGNTFIQTGGDKGHVTGAFFGPAHEAMGGVLERADLSAGFGGKR